MKKVDWNRYNELCENIANALADFYDEEVPVIYEFAVNPKTFEVKVIEQLSETPDGWIYESIVDAEWSTIQDCAAQYFDFRR